MPLNVLSQAIRGGKMMAGFLIFDGLDINSRGFLAKRGIARVGSVK